MSAPRFTGTPLTISRLMQPVNTTTLYASPRYLAADIVTMETYYYGYRAPRSPPAG